MIPHEYEPPREMWTPQPTISSPPIELGRFNTLSRGQWHILTQKGKMKTSATLCGTVNILRGTVTLSYKAYHGGDYRNHTCIDCQEAYAAKRPARDILFDARKLITYPGYSI